MNNSQFRLLLDASSPQRVHKDGAIPSSSSGQQKNGSNCAVLGSRTHSSIPMTPRSVTYQRKTSEFTDQVAEHKRATLNQGQPKTKRYRSSAAPKGSKLGAGYLDRAAHLRQQQADDAVGNGDQDRNDKAERIKSLEEMVKLQQIDQATFEKLRDEIGVGGDLESTHLVKGLDRKLLERVRRGEDVTTSEVTATEQEESEKRDRNERQDVDEELESVLEKEVQAGKREERNKKGKMAPPSSLSVRGERMSRDEILERLKASRAAAGREVNDAGSKEPSLGSKFRKVGSKNQSEKTKFVETVNGRRREVLVITKPDGTVKRKVRWIGNEDSKPVAHDASTAGSPLGMDIPVEIAAKQRAMLEKQRLEEEADEDIFTGVRADYDPLDGLADDSEDDSHSEMADEAAALQAETEAKTVQTAGKPRNYFSPTTADEENMKSPTAPTAADPTILAALKRAAAIRMSQEDGDQEDGEAEHEAPETEASALGREILEKLRKRERDDAADLDLGFGQSRFGDEEDEEGPIWDGEEKERRNGRKRGRKKRKGNKDAVSDVMAVLARGKT